MSYWLPPPWRINVTISSEEPAYLGCTTQPVAASKGLTHFGFGVAFPGHQVQLPLALADRGRQVARGRCCCLELPQAAAPRTNALHNAASAQSIFASFIATNSPRGRVCRGRPWRAPRGPRLVDSLVSIKLRRHPPRATRAATAAPALGTGLLGRGVGVLTQDDECRARRRCRPCSGSPSRGRRRRARLPASAPRRRRRGVAPCGSSRGAPAGASHRVDHVGGAHEAGHELVGGTLVDVSRAHPPARCGPRRRRRCGRSW